MFKKSLVIHILAWTGLGIGSVVFVIVAFHFKNGDALKYIFVDYLKAMSAGAITGAILGFLDYFERKQNEKLIKIQ